ncbi:MULTISPECIES: hypothetical protein [unclassified Microbacterium]|uniref:hypothetical protein n=1 Tax=unclassified Microbacterium TaxID=2609290 RepID=UPI00214AD980|nr:MULTISPECIES: hypothetical protein [unclassified Microbacterium]MCR2784599.1 hypothetical protein [Microbacterium sp. zg.B96]MDL5350482.1 hypothetical protein [Microbacterium sp. zg-YB36]WIM14594.1 hypothetical protein QNO11_08390 [Microbacterium sp. zg-B96]
METRTMTPAETAELAALRRRAYGPAADIGADAAALARLHELERAAVPTRHRTEAAPVGAEPDAVVTAIPEFAVQDEPGSALTAAATGWKSIPPASVSAPVEPRTLTRIRRFGHRHPLSTVVGVTVLAAAFTGIATLAAQARPEAVLPVLDDAAAAPEFLTRSGMLDYLGIASDAEVTVYGSYEGMDAYAAAAHLGGDCLFVARDEAFLGYSCGRGGLDPMIDMLLGTEFPESDFDAPVGTLLRFIHRGDHVEVWVGEPDSPPTA